ncbi:MAG: DUF465 domain-containing protein [Paludibacterium sp.]|uniref:YdcH family protein n=1 Tax=Paludibacterium sp. TaxID=1917523 RepID=UPI0025D6A62B|nr:DUF465 domain-containing protein [Paludibacterium sp.]MBV8047126.1 DUF465 domain-containing protein [Paludibacterium sp.]MBV8648743.1 DUF465 domain-containing protein [Paludibacterium sp.]
MFREHRELISQLKQTDRHFERLFEEHNALDERIAQAEAGQAHLSEQEIETLKKRKLLLKDQIYAILQAKSRA